MSKQEIEEEKVVRICYENLDKFTDIYSKGKEENKIPDNIKLTVFCQGSSDEGFLINVTSDELGFEALIAQKWIIHSELEKLAGRSLQ
jgi:hypothetical protein